MDERAQAIEDLDAAAIHLASLVSAVREAIEDSPGIEPPDIAAMLEGRPSLRFALEALTSDGLEGFLSSGIDPATARTAFYGVIEQAEKKGVLARIQAASASLDKAHTLTGEAQLAALAEVNRLADSPRREVSLPLADLWKDHIESKSADKADRKETVQLDEQARGGWAPWFNRWLGPRGGLEPGQTLIIGGAPEAGKTSLGAALAVDAMAAGCPVLFWQLELGRTDCLEYLIEQVPGAGSWWESDFWTRAHRLGGLPEAWKTLLTVPQWPSHEAERLQVEIERHARKARLQRAAGQLEHRANGLVLVDYAQLLTLRDRRARDAGHEVLTTAVSRLVKAAAESGACLVLLSQLNKADRADASLADTALAGADLSRMADRVAFIQKANAEGKACTKAEEEHRDSAKGKRRAITWAKARGVYRGRPPHDSEPPRRKALWIKSRALHAEEENNSEKAGGRYS